LHVETNMTIFNVLFLCTGNSARSILAEALLNRLGQGKYQAFSAGSQPRGAVHPLALDTLKRRGISTEGLRSKSWHEFAQPGAPKLDVVITVCDSAAAEVCPVWPGHPTTAHWGLKDPAAVSGEGAEQAFLNAFHALDTRIQRLVGLSVDELDGIKLKQRLNEIGRT
jgi:arsenate reductase